MNTNDKDARLAALKRKMQADSRRSFDGKKDRADFWQTRMGKNIARLLHHPNDESEIIPYYNHAFQEKPGWFIEDCPGTIGLPCPVCEARRKGHERKEYFVTNVFVPDTGAVLWWKFGQQILDVIVAAQNGGVDPFDPIHGANLLVVKPNYSESRFQAAAPLGSEDEIKKILAKCRPLSSLLNLRPYSDLKAKYERIAGAVQKTNK